MKRQFVTKGMLALTVSVAAVLCFILQPFDSVNAGPPTPTPTPEKTLLRLDVEAPEENLSTLEHDDSVSKMVSACAGTSFQRIFYSIADADVRQGYLTSNYGSGVEMWCGYDDYLDPDGQIVRCLIKFDISSLSAGATINSAVLKVYLVGSWDYPGRTRTYTTYRIPSDWSENTVTWNNAPSYAEAYGSTGVTHGSGSWYSFDVTNLVRAWHNGTYPNYGIMIRGPEWSGSDSSWKAFSTRESTADPYLVVDYVPPPPPTLGASPTLLRFRAYGSGPNPEPQVVTISNITAGSLDWNAAKVGDASWLGLDKTSGTVTPSSPDIMNVSVYTSGLTYDTYTERIAITQTTVPTCSNRIVDVIFDYYEAQAPEQRIFLPMIMKSGGGGTSRDAVALVVGIADYLHCSSSGSGNARAGIWGDDMEWPDDDAQDIYNRLTLAGFSPEKVKMLTESAASYEAIQQGFNWLDAQENENTLVVVHYSGHGGQITDDNGDEADGKDEVIIPWDMYDDFALAIRDDEFDEWLSRLESKHVVVSLDSCYSAGMADPTGSVTSRGIGTVLGTKSKVAWVAEGDSFAQDISKPGRVVLTASPDFSFEFSALGNGVFTYFFEQALAALIADGNGDGWISAEEAFSYLECRVDNYVYDHTGHMEGGPYHQIPQLFDDTWGEEWITQP